MPSSPSTEVPAAFICDCDEWMRSACGGSAFYKQHESKRYCVLHYPGKEKAAAFSEALERKLAAKDFDFSGVWFPDEVNFSNVTCLTLANFGSATFSAKAYFFRTKFMAGADFNAVTFGAAVNFRHAEFYEGVNFGYATFEATANFGYSSFGGVASNFTYSVFEAETNFDSAYFDAKAFFDHSHFGKDADFSSATFEQRATFASATFGAAVSFTRAAFNAAADFSSSTFDGPVKFAGDDNARGFGDKSSLNLHSARIGFPEHVTFNTLVLHPHWFVNIDARSFRFTDVDWGWRRIKTKGEVESLKQDYLLSPHSLLAVACRNLALNAEENHRYDEASNFRYMAMDAQRLERWRGFAFWTLGWWYWVASGYGERVWRAFVVLVGVWLMTAALYTHVGFVRWEPKVSNEQEAAEARRDVDGQSLPLQRALTYSLGVMTLQKPEPRPATDAAQAVVMAETILGPVQAALLALAIRRKFMR